MPTATATEVFQKIGQTAETIKNADPRRVPNVERGDVVRQGDIYLTRLGKPPAKASEHLGRQLAPGNTQGSRHIVVGDCELYTPDDDAAKATLRRLIPATKQFEQFFGPVILAKTEITIEHPEHGHRTLPAGAYQVTYQRVWAQEVRRQLD